MAGWLKRLLPQRGANKRESLAAKLRDYPPYEAPHAGPPPRWTPEQARENLAYLLGHRDRRLKILGELLQAEGISIEDALDGGEWEPLVDALHHWANERWPELHDQRIANSRTWLGSSRRGQEIVYSMLMDVAILLAELIIRRNPGHRWELDLDEANGRDGMESYMRAVVRLPAFGDMPCAMDLDVEHVVVHRYMHPEYRSNRLLNEWKDLVGEAVSGAYEAGWNGEAARGRQGDR